LGVSGSSEIKYESLFKVLVDRIRGKNDENWRNK
jgi:hypothetical protein